LIIRCERCATHYELDEALLADEGSSVQCTRCQHVFKAFPRRATAATRAATAPPAPAAPRPRPEPAAARPPPPAAAAAPPGAAGEDDDVPEPPVRAARPGGAQVYRPPAAAQQAPPPVQRAPILKRDAVGAFEARLRWIHRLRWLLPTAGGVLAILLAVGGWFLFRGKKSDGGTRARAEALAILSRDDLESLQAAEAALDQLGAGDHGPRVARADAALARLLRAGALAELDAILAPTIGARQAERDQLARERPPGFEAREAALASEIHRAQVQLEAGQRASRELQERARGELRQLETELGAEPAVGRALAISAALAGDRERTERAARTTRGPDGTYDAWAELASASLEAEGDSATRDRGRARLEAVVAKNPSMLRARYLLASALADAGRKDDAVRAVDAILKANPKHERAQALRADLTAVVAPYAVVPVAGKVPEKPAAPARNAAAQPPLPAAAPGAPPVPAQGAAEPPATTQPTAPVPPAPLQVAPPPQPAPSGRSVPEGAEGPATPGAGGDAGGTGRQRPRREEPLPEITGG
jgi:predicted Zn finger-like uncharacterized protein